MASNGTQPEIETCSSQHRFDITACGYSSPEKPPTTPPSQKQLTDPYIEVNKKTITATTDSNTVSSCEIDKNGSIAAKSNAGLSEKMPLTTTEEEA